MFAPRRPRLIPGFPLIAVLLTACAGGAAVAVFFGGGGAATVPLVLFPGAEERKPALLLPFSAEVRGMALSPDGKRLYLGDTLHNTVNVIDTAQRKLIAVLDIGTGPRSLLVSADNRRLYVAHYGRRIDSANKLSIIDTSSLAVLDVLTVGDRPFAMLEDSQRQRLYLASLAGRQITAIDTSNRSVLGSISVDGEPASLALSDDRALLYVAIRSTDSTPVQDRVDAFDPDDLELGASNSAPQISVPLNPGDRPRALLLTPDGSKLLAVSPGDPATNSGNVWLIDTATHAATPLAVGSGAATLAITPDSRHAYVARGLNSVGDTDDDSEDLCGVDSGTPQNRLAVLDLSQPAVITNDVAVGDAPIALALFGEEGHAPSKLFSLSACADPVSGLGSLSRLDLHGGNWASREISLRARGIAAAINASGSQLWLAHPDGVSLLAPRSESVLTEIAARGPGPTRLALNPAGNRLHALLPGRDQLATLAVDSVQASEALLARAATGSRPSALAVTENGRVVVANGGFSRSPGESANLFDSATGAALASVRLSDGGSAVARGPISVATAGAAEPGIAYLAGFGDSFPNDRQPGSYVARLDASGQAVDLFSEDPFTAWYSAVAVDSQSLLSADGSVASCAPCDDSVVYSANFYNDGVLRRSGGSLFSDTLNTTDFRFGPNRPAELLLDSAHNVWVSQYDTFDELYNGTLVNSVGVLRIAPGAVVPGGSSALETEQLLPGGLASRIAIDSSDQLWTLHAGDRNFFCQVESTFCATESAVSVAGLSSVPQALDSVPRINVGRSPRGIAFAAGYAFVSNYFDGTLSVIDRGTLAVVATLAVGGGPMDVLAVGPRVYVANSLDGTLSVVDAVNHSVLRTVSLLE